MSSADIPDRSQYRSGPVHRALSLAVFAIVLPFLVFWLADPSDPVTVIVLFLVSGIAIGAVWQSWWSLAALAGLAAAWSLGILLFWSTPDSSPLGIALAWLVIAVVPAIAGAIPTTAASKLVAAG